MDVRDLTQRTGLFCCAALIFVAGTLQATSVRAESCSNPVRNLELRIDDETRSVIDALTAAEGSPQRADTLQAWLARHHDASRGAGVVLRSHVRVALAGEYLRQHHYTGARQLLSGVDLTSQVAVRAALLIAESYRLEGNEEQARAWMIRVSQRYSSDPEALDGMLLVAEDSMLEGQYELAWTLYNLAMTRLVENIEQLSQMSRTGDQLVDAMLTTRLDESREVSAQLIKDFLSSPDNDALEQVREIAAARFDEQCLAEQERAIQDRARQLSAQRNNIANFSVAMQQEREMLLQDISQLEEQLESARVSERGAIESELDYLRATLAATENQLASWRTQQDAMPDDAIERRAALQAELKTLQQQLSANREKMAEQMQSVIRGLRERYRALAGEAQLGRAQLMQLASSSDRAKQANP